MPKGIFNIREIYLYNDECCSPTVSQVVHWKRQFNNKGGGDGYTAKIKDSDYFIGLRMVRRLVPSTARFPRRGHEAWHSVH